jgi:hypothetical protein
MNEKISLYKYFLSIQKIETEFLGVILDHADENEMPLDIQQFLKSCRDNHVAQKYLTLYSSKGIE